MTVQLFTADAGFLTLEEIDESEYGLEIPSVMVETERKKIKGKKESKRSKLNEGDESLDTELSGDCNDKDEESKEGDVKKQKKKKKKKDGKKKKKELQKNNETNEEQGNAEIATGLSTMWLPHVNSKVVIFGSFKK